MAQVGDLPLLKLRQVNRIDTGHIAMCIAVEGLPTSLKVWFEAGFDVVKFFDKDGERREEIYSAGCTGMCELFIIILRRVIN